MTSENKIYREFSLTTINHPSFQNGCSGISLFKYGIVHLELGSKSKKTIDSGFHRKEIIQDILKCPEVTALTNTKQNAPETRDAP